MSVDEKQSSKTILEPKVSGSVVGRKERFERIETTFEDKNCGRHLPSHRRCPENQ
jgi:hypothetical protein